MVTIFISCTVRLPQRQLLGHLLEIRLKRIYFVLCVLRCDGDIYEGYISADGKKKKRIVCVNSEFYLSSFLFFRPLFFQVYLRSVTLTFLIFSYVIIILSIF